MSRCKSDPGGNDREGRAPEPRPLIADRGTTYLIEVGRIPVFPCTVGAKTPRLPVSWTTVATCDAADIAALFPVGEPRNVAAAVPRGIIVIDPDDRGTPNGLEDWERLVAANGVPRTVTALTGGGGKHVWFRIPDDLKVRGSLSANIQVKAHGGYVLLPPSIHPSGARYRWARDHSPLDISIAPAPGWLLGLIVKPARQARVRERRVPGYSALELGLGRFLDRIRALAACTVGRRNEMANRVAYLAGVLSGRGQLSGDQAMVCLEGACVDNGLFAEEPEKTAGTLQRAFAAGVVAAQRTGGGQYRG